MNGPARRRAELAGNLDRLDARIGAACAAAGRERAEVTLVAVTKTYPASDVAHLAALGVRDIGENRDQEAAPKVAAVAELGAAVRWHFVGRLQRNKCRSVVGYADMVHSVDSVRLARALAEAAGRSRERPLDVLIQLSIDGDPRRGGALAGAEVSGRSPAGDVDGPDAERDLDRIAAVIAESGALRLRGLMAVAPLEWEPDRAFARLAEVAAALRIDHPDATLISAGMSGDLESAIRHGATHVRVGSALLGMRSMLR